MTPLTPLLSTRAGTCVLTGLLLLVLGALTGLSAVPTLAAGSRTWTFTGSMHVAREDATATLLPSGQVLVAGGLDSNYNYLASAELYTPWHARVRPGEPDRVRERRLREKTALTRPLLTRTG